MEVVDRLPSLTPADESGEVVEEADVIPVEENDESYEILDDTPLV